MSNKNILALFAASLFSLMLVWFFAPRFSVLEVAAIRSTSTSYIVPLSELLSISGPSTSTSFKLNSAGGQQATGISTSTSYNAWAGILYSIFGDGDAGPVITVSGTVYSDDGITTATSTVSISVNGGAKSSVSTNGGGVYSFPTVAEPDPADVITVWLDNGTTTKTGAAVTRYDTGSITDLHIYKEQLITRHEDAGPLNNTQLGLCTKTIGTGCADSDIHFDISGGNLTVDNDWGLYLWGGDTFTPGGTVTLSSTATPGAAGGDIKWASSTSVISLSSNALSVGGDFNNAALGSFSISSAQSTTFTATANGFVISPNGAFSRVTFNGSGGGWSVADTDMAVGAAALSNYSLTMTDGTLNNDNGTASIIVTNGNVTGSGGIINLTAATFTMRLVASTTANFGSTSGDWTFKDLLFNNASTTTGTFRFTTLTSGTGNVNVSDNLQIISSGTAGNTTALDAGNRTWTLSGSDGIPFHIVSSGGTSSFESVSSTVTYTGVNSGGNTTTASTTYWNVAFTAGSPETYVFGTDTLVNNNLILNSNSNTVDTTGVSVTVNNAYSHSAGTLNGTGNVTVKGAMTFGALATVSLTGGTFEHLVSASTTIQISAPSATSVNFYNFKMNNSASTARTVGLTMIAVSGFAVTNDWTIGDNSSSTYIFNMGGGITTPLIDINNDTTFSTNATVRAATSTIRTARNLTVTGTLTPASSTFQFDTTTTSTITGSTGLPLNFNNFTANTANKPLVFASSTPYFEMRGLLTLTGTNGNPVTLDSTASGTQWLINHQGTESVQYISLKDSGCIATSTDITITSFNVTDRGNNDDPCWLIAPRINVSGTVYSDEGVTTATSTVTLAVGGSTAYTTSTDGSGAYAFANVAQPATSTVLTVWMDNASTTKSGATVTRYIGNSDVTGLDIYRHHLITRHEDSGPLSNANIGVCDSATGSVCGDADLHFNETSNNLTVDSDWGLYLWPGDTLTPGGTITLSPGAVASAFGGDLTWASSTSVLDVAGNALSVGGDWLNTIDGTFTRNAATTVTFTATQSGMAISPGTQMFADMTFNGSGGAWSPATTTVIVDGSMQLTAGTVDNSAGSAGVTVHGGDVLGTSGAFNLTTGTFLINQPGSGSRTIGASAANWNFFNLTVRNTSTTSTPANFIFVGPDTVTTTISGTFSIGNSNPVVPLSIWYASNSNVALAGAVASPITLINTGNISFQSSTIAYTGNNGGGNTSIVNAATSFWNLVLDNAAETYTGTGLLGARNDLTVNAGILDATGFASLNVDRDFRIASAGTATLSTGILSVGRDFTNAGAFTAGSSTVIFDTTATSTITGSSTFWSVTAQTANKPLVFKDGNTFTVNGNLFLEGTAGNLLTIDSSVPGTQWFINHQGTETVSYTSVKDSGCDVASTYITVSPTNSVDRGNNGFCWLFPSLSFTVSPLSVNLSLNEANTFTNTGTNTLTVSTNAQFGYSVTAYAESLMTKVGGATTIANWTGTNASPTVWTTSCIASATCGFGYSTDDADLTQFSSTKFAGFTTSTPGEVVATDAGMVTSDATVMTYRASVDLSQAAGDYQATIRYIVTPGF